MNNAKHSGGKRTPRHGRRLGFGRQVLLLAALAVIAMGVVGGTVAYLVTNTGSVTNTFEPGYVKCVINEKFDEKTKQDVTVKNDGNVDAYIRATYVINWLDSSGNIVASVPEGYGCTLTVNPDNKWKKGADGYFYYPSPVAPKHSTEGSLLTCTVIYPDENPKYTLQVEILADAIQSSPDSAVIQAWGDEALRLVKSN